MKLTNEELFTFLWKFLYEMNVTNSTKEKKIILKKYNWLRTILNYVYDPFKKYHITIKQLDKRSDLCSDAHISKYSTVFELLDKLTNREVTGHDAIGMINYFISNNKKYEHIIKLIIGKDLKCRIGASIINDVFPGLVPQFKVALAEEYDESMSAKEGWDWGDWIVMRKLDGLRCITIIDNESNAKFFSRKGIEFLTLGKIAGEIKAHGIRNMVLDGELCIVDEDGNEDFKAISKEYKKKNHTIEHPKYIVFDQLTLDEFENSTSEDSYGKRRYLYKNNFYGQEQDLNYIERIDSHLLKDKADFDKFNKLAKENRWEGLILRKNVGYEGKRTKNILKVKSFFDAEYTVEDIETGPFRIINKGTKLEETIETLTSVLIKHKGYTVNVGSGFSIPQRKHYFEHPEEIIGKEITVKYFEETTNQSGGISLRFPTIKKIWTEGKRDV